MADGGSAAIPEAPGLPSAPAAPAGPEAGAALPDRVHWLQRAMAGAAVLLGAIVAGWGLLSPLGVILVPPFVAIAWTVFVRERGSFQTLCLGVGLGVSLFGVVLACFGTFAFIPSALILLMARAADPRQRPVLARVLAGITAAMVAAALTGAGWLAYDVWRVGEPSSYTSYQ
ncbi:hypothetical protein [Streptomyces sp. NBC_01565]|uniref:hypothetical protein n=1 Tax=Streptomyces sp. NBC_01565 TaxID=2975881 RepID=UPI00224D6947|nr:hypothetical protein [Streptomyces sp. NBC_01565]MCX4546163.1 hypothetical protein [Streptomyces sp. NBC_01565]